MSGGQIDKASKCKECGKVISRTRAKGSGTCEGCQPNTIRKGNVKRYLGE